MKSLGMFYVIDLYKLTVVCGPVHEREAKTFYDEHPMKAFLAITQTVRP